MGNGTKRGFFEQIWRIVDAILLIAICCLLGVAFFAQSHDEWSLPPVKKHELPPPVKAAEPLPTPPSPKQAEPESPEPEKPVRPRVSPLVKGLRVAHERQQRRKALVEIAQDMVGSDWRNVPVSPAMDMRQDEATFDVFFTLRKNIQPDSVHVSAAGKILTLTMRHSSGRKLLERFQLPCECGDAFRRGDLKTTVSNGVVHVRINMAGSAVE